ncbi:hypothetical protein ACROYT_G018729 [Oculina patagonica]
MKFAWTTFLLVLLLVSALDARKRNGRKGGKGRKLSKAAECNPTGEYQMIFQEHTITDYAIKNNSIVYDLHAATVCLFAKDTDDNKPSGGYGGNECVYSYSDAEASYGNALLLCTSPSLRVWLENTQRNADVGLDFEKWNHICFTWSNTNGDYKFYKDGAIVGSGTGVNVGGKISSGGITVIGQDQDKLGGGFEADESFVGEVTEVNVWGTVLSESDIVAQFSDCHIPQGSVNWWSQFKDGVHGGVVVVEP